MMPSRREPVLPQDQSPSLDMSPPSQGANMAHWPQLAEVLADISQGKDIDQSLAALARIFDCRLRLTLSRARDGASLDIASATGDGPVDRPLVQQQRDGVTLALYHGQAVAGPDATAMATCFLRALPLDRVLPILGAPSLLGKPSMALLLRAFEALPDGVMLYDDDERLVLANSRLCASHQDFQGVMKVGMRYDDIVEGILQSKLLPEAGSRDSDFVNSLYDPDIGRPCGQVIEFSNRRFLRLRDADLLGGGRLSLRTDVTEDRVQSKRLAEFVKGAQVGMWEWNLHTGSFLVDRHWNRVLGYDENAFSILGLDCLSALIHPQDRPQWLAGLSAMRHGNARSFDVVARLRKQDGSWLWVQTRGHMVDDARMGMSSWAAGVAIDVSQLKAAEGRVEQLIDAAMVGIWRHDPLSDHIKLNDIGAKMLGLTPSERRGLTLAGCWSRVHPDDYAEINTFARASDWVFDVAKPRPIRIRHRDGHWVWLALRGQSQRCDEAGQVVETSGLVMDITATVEAETALAEALARAEAASRSKSQFLTTMSHELRTPLVGVLGMADLLARSALSDEQQGMIATIRGSAEHLQRLVTDILDLAKVESGKLELNEAKLDLSALIRLVTDSHRVAAEAKGLRMDLELATGPAMLRKGDQLRLSQILHNLLDNAVKFTQSGSVHLTVQPADDASGERVHIRLRDTGIDMSEAQLAVVFDEFTQADGSIARRFGGSGLGLSIVRRMVDRMQGRLEVQTALGQGCDILVELPLPRVVTQNAHDPAPQTFDPPPVPAELPRGLRVLVADDNGTNRMILRAMLLRFGAEVSLAETGDDALQAVRNQHFDVILLDIAMPGKDGLETLREMQAEARAMQRALPPVLAATANVQQQQQREYLEAGFGTVLLKPISLVSLAEALLPYVDP